MKSASFHVADGAVAVPRAWVWPSRHFVAFAKALTGEWALKGKVVRLHLRRTQWVGGGYAFHLIAGRYCFTAGRLNP